MTNATKGGRRPGSGRKPQTGKNKYNVNLSDHALALVQARANAKGVRLNRIVQDVLEQAVQAGVAITPYKLRGTGFRGMSGRIKPEVRDQLIAIAAQHDGVNLSDVFEGAIRERLG